MLVKDVTFSKFPAVEGKDMLVIPKAMSADDLATKIQQSPALPVVTGWLLSKTASDKQWF